MKKISKVIDTSNPFFEQVDCLKIKKERYILGDLLSAKPGTRPSEQRGKKVSEQKLEALIWGLSYDNPVVRWQCFELLDAHPDQGAVPDILRLLNDPVPRVRCMPYTHWNVMPVRQGNRCLLLLSCQRSTF